MTVMILNTLYGDMVAFFGNQSKQLVNEWYEML